MSIQGEERRKYIRFPFNYPVLHRPEGAGEWNYSHSDNIGFGGMEFPSTWDYAVGDFLALKINFPDLEQGKSIFKARVVTVTRRAREAAPSRLVGVAFVDLTPAQHRLIERMISERAEQLEERKRGRATDEGEARPG
jgi:c-di-GMP-binding flagellar brake protein YcgR